MMEYKNLGNMNQTLYQGPGAIRAIPEICAMESWKKIMVVADPFIASSGMLAPFEALLREAGIEYCVFSKIRPNPEAKTIETEAVPMFRRFGADAMLAIGGGSSMDTAKGVALIGDTDMSISEIVSQLTPVTKVTRRIHKVIAVPTTCGTGSECTKAAVICDENDEKMVPINDCLLPAYAVCDPELLASLPRSVAAATAMDALVQAAEIFVGKGVGDFAWTLSLRAIELMGESLRAYVDNPADIYHADHISLACMYAGIAWQMYIPTQIHGTCHCLTERYHISHGETCAVLFPAWAKLNGWAAEEKLHTLYNMLFPQKALKWGYRPQMLVDELIALNRELGILGGRTLRECGCCEADIDGDLLKNAVIFPACPAKTTMDTLKTMYKMALDGYQ